jgi:MYXO-CTERM domain-containing protein
MRAVSALSRAGLAAPLTQMAAQLRSAFVVSVAAMLLACGNTPQTGDAGEAWSEASQALNACNETVPAMRAVDGIPAYAQCDAIESGAIWSNNGVDTASSSQGAGWVRTQYSGGYQCTELARRYMLFRWDIDYQHGNAGEWCDGELPSTLELAATPTHGDLIVFAPGSCGADSTTGHVAIVDTVDMAGGKVTIVEQNQASRRTTQQTCAKCFLHAVANDGSSGGSGGAASGGAGGGGTTSGGSPSAAGSASGGAPMAGASTGGTPSTGGAGAAAMGGSPSGGTSPSGGGASSGTAAGGSTSASGSSSSGAPAAGAGSEAPADDAGCSVTPGGAPGTRSLLALFVAGASLLLRRRKSIQGSAARG